MDISNLAVQLGTAFGAGFVSSLTPCVYPLIPVTLAIFGANANVPRWRAFLLSVSYVLGIAVTYTALGMISAKTGAAFGSHLGNPIVVGVIFAFLVFLVLFTLDIVKLNFLATMQTKANKVGGKGFVGAFLMGTVSGVVAAPCVGPFLVTVLGVAASSGNTLLGGALLFSYSLGLGLIFIVLGTFSGLLKKIPRSGNWLYGVKFIMAVALLTVALFIGQTIMPKILTEGIVARAPWALVPLAIAGIALAYIGQQKSQNGLKLIASAMVSIALFQGVVEGAPPPPTAHTITWLPNIEAGLANAKARGTITMVDLFADWCAACKELEKLTFSKDSVRAKLGEISTVRIDHTTDTPVTEKIDETYKIIGLPSILFLTPTGAEIPDSRITGFMDAPTFLEHVNKVIAAAK